MRFETPHSREPSSLFRDIGVSGALLHRDNIATSERTDFLSLGDMPIGRRTGSTVSYLHPDHLGSPAAATDANGNLLWREDFSPFGEPRQNPAANKNQTGYTGHIADSDIGLAYMQARYYDARIGRFLAPDPVGFAEGGNRYFNRYAYVRNDPLNMFDPNGQDSVSIRFRDQPIHDDSGRTIPPWAQAATVGRTGHSGIGTINEGSGLTHYYEFGRYGGDAQVRQLRVPNLEFSNGVPTTGSIRAFLGAILDIGARAGSDDIGIEWDLGTDFEEMEEYVAGVRADDPNWSPWGMNCHTFCNLTARAGGGNGPQYNATLTRRNLNAVAAGIIGLYRREDGEPGASECNRNPTQCNPGDVR